MLTRIKPPDQKNIFDRKVDNSWQVRVYHNGTLHGGSFAYSVYGGRDAALLAAKARRDEIYQEVGMELDVIAPAMISDRLPSSNNSGILGVTRSESIDKHAAIREVWQTTYPTPDGTKENKPFNIKRLGEIGALRAAVEARMEGISRLIGAQRYLASQQTIKILIDKYLNILVYLDSLTENDEKFLVATILDKSLKNTVKEEIINGRVGQGGFKDKLLKLWGNQCSVTGSQSLLNASHIKPWAKCSNKERLDPFNGFLFSPAYDRAFDAGFITFTDAGEIVIAKKFTSDAALIGVSSDAKINRVSPFSLEYLNYHRCYVYVGP